MAEEPEEVDDEDRQGSNKEAICDDDPNDMDDDCPTIFNMGGNAEMVLNKVVRITVWLSLVNEDDLLVGKGLYDERIIQFHEVYNALHESEGDWLVMHNAISFARLWMRAKMVVLRHHTVALTW